MKVAILASGSPYDPNTWSGTPFFMTRELAKHFDEVRYFPRHTLAFNALRTVRKIASTVSSKKWDPVRSIAYSRWEGQRLSRAIDGWGADVIFAIACSELSAHLVAKAPFIHCSDATFSSMLGYYPNFRMLSPRTIKGARYLDMRSASKSAAALYPSDWAAQSAINEQYCSSEKVFVVPLGANLLDIPAPRKVAQRKVGTVCRLLFVGKDWERKGGDLALSVLQHLVALGVDARLVVVGCTPPSGQSHPFMSVVPFLNKNLPEDRERLHKLYLESDFLFVPSRHEAYGVVFCEASAFGVPSLSTRTGGIPSVVHDGINGFLFTEDSPPIAYAQKIASVWTDTDAYARLSQSSRHRFETELNWQIWGQRVFKLITDVVRYSS